MLHHKLLLLLEGRDCGIDRRPIGRGEFIGFTTGFGRVSMLAPFLAKNIIIYQAFRGHALIICASFIKEPLDTMDNMKYIINHINDIGFHSPEKK
jgi:hypothetical protein